MIENSILKDLNRECGKIRKRLEDYGGHPIRLVEDDSVSFGGDVEYCLTHHRYENVIRYNPDDYADSLLHGLLRLEMAIDNTIAGRKKAIFTRLYHRERFHQRYGKEIRKLLKDEKPFIVKGMEIVTYDTHIKNLVETVMNLLVMERQYQEYPAFRNLQRKRAEDFLQEEIDVLRNTEYRGIIPKRCEQVDKIQNLVYAMHLCDLFGVNLLEEFFPSKNEMNHAKDLYEEFKACCRFFEPGKEYELLEYFALSLGMEKLFDIGDEPKEDIRLYSGYDDDESTFERLYEEYLSPERKEMPKEVAQVKMAQFILRDTANLMPSTSASPSTT